MFNNKYQKILINIFFDVCLFQKNYILMASIRVSNLHPVGLDLFADSEYFMTELTENELTINYGGGTPLAVGIAVATFAGGYLYGRFR